MYYQMILRSEAFNVSDKSIRDIFNTLKRLNKANNISGCLVFKDGYFLQFLEGVRHEVEDIFFTIQDDNRHDNIELLYQGESAEQIFTEWKMAYFYQLEVGGNTDEFLNRYELELLMENCSKSFSFKIFNWHVHELLSEGSFYYNKFKDY